jgi:ubiquinone/menaquinone biosynthesis C-methylase UbiE
MAETRKAHKRRVKEGFYRKYINGQGIDIGCGRIDTHDGADTISLTDCIHHDKDICDATTMETFQDNEFDYVYASHVLEHLDDPVTAIKNWQRICKPGGWIIISLPHRDLYERKKTLPSRWNEDHRYFYLPDRCEPPHTFSVAGILRQAGVDKYKMKVIDTATNADRPEEHNNGEFSIEVIIRKEAKDESTFEDLFARPEADQG